MLQLLRNWRARRLRPEIEDQKAFYGQEWSPAEIQEWQLRQFNKQWESIRVNVPYYARLVKERGLPKHFDSWEQFRNRMPVIDREAVQKHGSALASTERTPDLQRVTGGSTAEPIQIPVWSSERKYEQRDFWYARDWHGVTPADRLFLLWGHSHIFREGIRGWLDKVKREVKDWLLGYHRFSAYDLGKDAMREAAKELMDFQPDYVVGYSEALDRFARINRDRKDALRSLDLKVIIATAESFPKEDSARVIEDAFGSPVVMEYGTAETGPIAYQDEDEKFQIFWRHFKVEGEEANVIDGTYKIYVTTLYSRCFPLVRYRVGDIISENPGAGSFDQSFESVIGRSNDCISLSNEKKIHSIVFKHTLEDLKRVRSYQVVSDEEEITLYCVISDNADFVKELKGKIRKRLKNLSSEFADAKIRQVSSIDKTPAGKTKRVVQE
jgi:phenylacetate-coenzyme A ligase PaaK-like adenylate-forming protein